MPVGVDHRRAPAANGDDLAALDLKHPSRLGQEGGDGRSEEGLAVAEPDDQRALLAGGDQRVGVVRCMAANA